MNRLVVPLAILGMAGFIFLIIGDVGFQAPPVPDVGPVDAAPPPPPPPPKPIYIADAAVPMDLAVPEDTPSVESLRTFGVFGRDASFLDEFLKGDFERVEDRGGPTYKNIEGTLLTFRVEGGKVTGARADFDQKALSATLTGLSWIFSGNRDHIPMHWEGETAGERYDGRYQDRFGRTYFYRGALQSSGFEGLYGPAWVEISQRAFPKP